MAEVDAEGNVNVSRFGRRLAGAGGFINISQNAKALSFHGHLHRRHEGRDRRRRLHVLADMATDASSRLQQRRSAGPTPAAAASRCTTSPSGPCSASSEAGLLLTEIAPGVDLERDVLAHMDFAPIIAADLREMDPRIFRDEPMGLSRHTLVDLNDRLVHHPEDNVLYVNLEGLHLDTAEQAQELADLPGPTTDRPRPPRARHRQLRQPRARPHRRGDLLHHDPREHR